VFAGGNADVDIEMLESATLALLINHDDAAIAASVVLGALRLQRFTLVRGGDVLRNSRGLLGKQTATIPIKRIEAVRVVEGFGRMLLGDCILQVEAAGIGRANADQRMHLLLVRMDRAGSLIQCAVSPCRLNMLWVSHCWCCSCPVGWELLAILPVLLAWVLGVARVRKVPLAG
jgi:Bacterial PH domain